MIMLVDGNNLAYRNYAVNPNLSTSKGEGTGAIFGTLKSLYLLRKLYSPDRICVFWDIGVTLGWRAKLFPAYKAHRRVEMDQERALFLEEYHRQRKEISEVLSMLGIQQIGVAGVEADDLIGIAVHQLRGLSVSIVSSDHDFYQLLAYGNVTIMRPTGKGDYEFITAPKFIEKYKFSPGLWPDARALMGDSSDNIPGVRGIGEMRATEVMRAIGGLRDIEVADPTGRSDVDRLVLKIRMHMSEAVLYRLLSVIPCEPNGNYYDKGTVASIKKEMKKLGVPAQVRKAEFEDFCLRKEMRSIYDARSEWLWLFGGNVAVLED
jgi:5'-3' exonuclease